MPLAVSAASLFFAVVGTAFAQVLYKRYFQTREIVTLLSAIFLFLCIPPLAFLALKELDLGMVYTSTALTQVLVVGISKYYLGENVTLSRIGAIIVVVIGVFVYAS